jgi:hypothetical protein
MANTAGDSGAAGMVPLAIRGIYIRYGYIRKRILSGLQNEKYGS